MVERSQFKSEFPNEPRVLMRLRSEFQASDSIADQELTKIQEPDGKEVLRF